MEKKVIRLTESDLTKLVKRIMTESQAEALASNAMAKAKSGQGNPSVAK